jgi:type VI secretion system ImpB/VipA family protein
MAESTQHKLDRVRPPRVQITYDVEIGNAIEKKQLPLVVGVMADLGGKPAEAPAPLRRRKFVEIDRDNFNGVMSSIAPRLAFRAPNRLANDDSQLSVELRFDGMEDFDPVAVLNQVEPLRRLFEARQRLSDLIGKLDGNDELDRLLRDVVSQTDQLQAIKGELAPPAADAATPAADAAALATDAAPPANA